MNRDEEIMASLKQQGLEMPTLGEMLGDVKEKIEPINPPRHPDQSPFPTPGIYFGMPEEQYHSIPACSTSALKKLSISMMDCWASSSLNLDRTEIQKPYLDYGKAIHAFVLEGEDEYLARYAVDLDIADFEGQSILVSTEEIKAAIGKFMELAPVKPVGTKKQDLLDQLVELAEMRGTVDAIDRAADVAGLKAQIGAFLEPQPVKPVSKVTDTMDDGTEYQRAAVKTDWIDQLLALDPDAKVWDRMVADHRASHEGKTMIHAANDRRIRIASRMILAHEEIAKAVQGGWPEVSVFWFCSVTGAPMKARFDYLKMRMIADLKSFGNNAGMPIDRAIERTIAAYRYPMQHVIYEEAAMQARAMIRDRGVDEAVFHCGEVIDEAEVARRDEFCAKWAQQTEAPGFMFIFQQSGDAPVTRGKIMPKGTVYSVTKSRCEDLKRKWVECAKTYGVLPWLDIQPVDEIEDERIPLWATEI